MFEINKGEKIVSSLGVQPHFSHKKNVSFPIFSYGESSIWKERKKYSFPSLSISFFPMGKETFFPWEKWG